MEKRIAKFRGKSFDSELWVYGNYVYGYLSKQHFIVVEEGEGLHKFNRINPETIRQCIGIEDKEGQEIYTGDRLQIISHIATKGDGEKIFNEHLATAIWSTEDYGFRIKYDDHVIQGKDFLCEIKMLKNAEIKIISRN